MSESEFLKPRLCGNRFERGGIPLDMLKDISVLGKMAIDVAKWCYLQDNPDRHRSPRGFTDGVEFEITQIQEGSAVPVICLRMSSPQVPLPGMAWQQIYFEKAREAILGVIASAERGDPTNGSFPQECLAYFDRFGRSLQEDEYIEFEEESSNEVVRYSKEVRKRLVLSSQIQQITEEVTLYGYIPEADQDRMTFELQLLGGKKIPGQMLDQHVDTIIQAFSDYRNNCAVSINGIGKYDRRDRFIGLDSVEHIGVVDSVDAGMQLESIRNLEDGWYGTDSVAPSKDGIDWFTRQFMQHYPADAPQPLICPTFEGDISLEWSHENNAIIFDVNLVSEMGEWFWFDKVSAEEEERDLDLNSAESWDWIIAQIRGKVRE